MLRDVRTTISDGGLISAPSGSGVHAKIGVSPKLSTSPILIKGSMSAKKIQEQLGLSPLADACMDSVENGASLIYCIPVAASVDGKVGEVKKTGTGTGTLTITGKPNNSYQLVVKITKEGGLNEAACKYSFDGGLKFSEEITIPISGQLALAPTGLTLVFATGAENAKSFELEDTFTISTTAPQMNNEDVLTAIDKLRKIKATIEFVHIVGETSKALWSVCATTAENFFSTYFKPLFFVLEAPNITTGQTVEAYATSLISDRKGCNSIYVQVVTARGIYTRMDGTTQEINLAGIVSGFYAQADVQQSIGEVKSFHVSENKLLSLTPVGIEDYLAELDAGGFLTFRAYEGLAGWYVTNARMLAPEGSDYQYAERVRVHNQMAREVRKELLMQLQSQIDISNLDAELEAIAKFAETPLDQMIADKEISAARIIIPEGQDILSTEKLNLIIRYVPIGYVREMEVNLGMENPFVKEAYAIAGVGVRNSDKNEAYDTATNLWSTKAPASSEMTNFGCSAVGNSIFIIGGSRPSNDSNLVDAYMVNGDVYPAKTAIVQHGYGKNKAGVYKDKKVNLPVYVGNCYYHDGAALKRVDSATNYENSGWQSVI
ncbi:DUF2586 domain-containing protein [Hydrogenoanaerobacterium sp.]|uniref:DUF2586 domain-containing protein n=1 Tax=Hydrogenoanaerobacterium sp. TaxID=2953763 RepID=UPI00289DA890|nr:DUF2586 domain-containing protein [Hydrogenoanaerobacterium sp.]